MIMEHEGDSQPTQQATQDVLDPRRLGKQNSGFTDEEISDIICLLIPASDTARRETKRIALDGSNAMIACHDEGTVDRDYGRDDDVARFELVPQNSGQQEAVVLRLSAQVKNPAQGFTFGRNANRCDICFVEDPFRRLSNVHFRIYLNDYGVLMIQDMSTNGTVVDEMLLKAKSSKPHPMGTRRTLSSGSMIKIPMHEEASDLEFYVRIPRREGEYERAYRNNLAAYTNRLAQRMDDANRTLVPGPGGHVDLFGNGPHHQQAAGYGNNLQESPAVRPVQQSPEEPLPLTWNGSNKYNRIGEIGKGAFATVYKVTSKFDGLPYAAKELDRRRFMKNGVIDQKVENEMTIMKRITHPNIVRYVEHLEWDNRLLIIIMEYVPGGDLGRLVHDKGSLAEPDTQAMAKQLLGALSYLHQNNITHRDVKPDNILIESLQPLSVKLTDFGLSKIVDNEETFLRTFCGTLLYCAPEVYSEFSEYDEDGRRLGRHAIARKSSVRRRYDHAVDVWSLGGVLFYALSGCPPYPARNGISYSELLHQIMTKRLDIGPLTRSHVSGKGIDCLALMLERRPEKRATMKGLLRHAWVGGPGFHIDSSARSDDEVSDEEQILHVRASQLSLEDKERLQSGGQGDPLGLYDLNEEESVEDSQKENYTFAPGDPPAPRLFGEVDMNLSAIGLAGAIPAHRLNLPMSSSSLGVVGASSSASEVADSYESENRSTPQPESLQQSNNNGGVSLSLSDPYPGQSRSVDQLNNATFNESSQDLGGAESILENLNMKSLAGSHLREARASDVNTSKRRASSFDKSDELEQSVLRGKPAIKRFKSENLIDSGSESEEEELPLLARLPSLARQLSGRVIDSPVHKATFWTMDKKSWHLQYPEMTQLQLDAFRSAAQTRGEEFLPGKSPLWALACKYFPPTYTWEDDVFGEEEANGGEEDELQDSPTLGRTVSGAKLPSTDPGCGVVPSTAALADLESLPDTLPPGASNVLPRGVPVPRRRSKRVIASLRSAPDSDVPDINISMTESMVSWGRAPQNTRVYPFRDESRVPKFAFKIMLWRDDYDASRNLRPWARSPTFSQGDSFYCYISTKATNGITVNGFVVPSYDRKNTDSPARNWLRLHDGDVIDVWRAVNLRSRISLVFQCKWGGSMQPRPAPEADSLFGSPVMMPAPTLAPEAVARKLDDACLRAEKRLHNLTERDVRMEDADHDVDLRMEDIERERYLSEVFERRRAEACRILKARASRRQSPAGMPLASTTGHNTLSAGTSATVAGGLRIGGGLGLEF